MNFNLTRILVAAAFVGSASAAFAAPRVHQPAPAPAYQAEQTMYRGGADDRDYPTYQAAEHSREPIQVRRTEELSNY